MDSHARILVVGGGIFGVSTALALAQDGHAHVELLERDRVGSANTALAAGIVSLQTWNDEDAHLILRTRRAIEELVAWGRDQDHPAAATLWKPTGGITITPPSRLSVLEAMRERIRGLGSPATLLSPAEAEREFRTLRFADDEVVLYGPHDGHVASTDLVELVRQRVRVLGVRVREEIGVDRVETEEGRVTGVAFNGGSKQRADEVVIAGGAWTRALLARSGATIPAIPYRTQLCALQSSRAPPVVVHDAVHGFYARPESETRFLAGDGTELRPFDPDTFDRRASPSFVESIAAAVPRRVRDTDVRYVNGWAGLCVGTPDRRPLGGPLPVKGLHVLTGDNGFGVMRGLALGQVVAARVAGRTDPGSAGVDPMRFGPEPPTDFPLGEGFSLPD